ncbi:MAG: glycosyltransferase [Acidimicrobiales bacterium]
MINPSVTVFVASYNTRSATELAVRSAHRFAGCPFTLIVGDSASRDGSREMLTKLERRGQLQLVSVPSQRRHAQWLDWFLEHCPTRIGVIIDSDIELLKDGWLVDLVQALSDQDAAFVGSESTPEAPICTSADGESIHLMPRIAAPWLMALDVEKVRSLGCSFNEERGGIDAGGLPFLYDVAGYTQKMASDAGFPVVAMPSTYAAKYHHFRGLSWRRETGIRAARHYLKFIRLYGRLILRRFDKR